MTYNDETEITVISTVEDMSDALTEHWGSSIIDLLGWDGAADEAARIRERFEKWCNVSIEGDAVDYFDAVIEDQYKEIAEGWAETIQYLSEYEIKERIRQNERTYQSAWYGS